MFALKITYFKRFCKRMFEMGHKKTDIPRKKCLFNIMDYLEQLTKKNQKRDKSQSPTKEVNILFNANFTLPLFV